MRSPWRKLPPLMERTLLDDVLLAVCILVGAALGALVFGADGASVQGFVIGAVTVIVILQVLRFVVRGAGTHRDKQSDGQPEPGRSLVRVTEALACMRRNSVGESARSVEYRDFRYWGMDASAGRRSGLESSRLVSLTFYGCVVSEDWSQRHRRVPGDLLEIEGWWLPLAEAAKALGM